MENVALAGHTSPDTAYVVADYPYGFRLRCQIRYWIETHPKRGQRVVSQTTNPKRSETVWNKPKASTYSDIRVLYIDGATGYVENAALNFYAGTAEIAKFEETFSAALTSDRDQSVIRVLKLMAAKQDERVARQNAAVAESTRIANGGAIYSTPKDTL